MKRDAGKTPYEDGGLEGLNYMPGCHRGWANTTSWEEAREDSPEACRGSMSLRAH